MKVPPTEVFFNEKEKKKTNPCDMPSTYVVVQIKSEHKTPTFKEEITLNEINNFQRKNNFEKYFFSRTELAAATF